MYEVALDVSLMFQLAFFRLGAGKVIKGSRALDASSTSRVVRPVFMACREWKRIMGKEKGKV